MSGRRRATLLGACAALVACTAVHPVVLVRSHVAGQTAIDITVEQPRGW